MKKTVLSFCMLLLMACTTEKFDPTEIWDNIHSLDERVTSLEQLCREMNTNIGSLQTIVSALENQDYIKNVSPVSEDGAVIGYTITFAYSDPVTIYHGKDGEKGEQGDKGDKGDQGEAGIDGQTPIIGIKQDADAIYYWTLNGSWLLSDGQKVKAVGTDGAKGEQGETGSQGPQGEQGVAGVDGVTPQLKIVDGRWFISYDKGDSWEDVGQATGDQGEQGAQGEHGKPGVSGDSMFTDINYSNNDYVVFTLSNGEQFKIPTWSAFEDLQKECEQMNANIEAMQTILSALQNNDYVTSVTPIYDGVKEIGYIINFSKSGRVTIYHGKGGEKGEQGDKGETGDKGEQGEAGNDGDSFFQSVTEDLEYIYLTLADGTMYSVPKTPAAAAVLTLANTTGFTATFDGTVLRSSLDLKVTVYYSTTPDLTVYKNRGKVSVIEFSGEAFTLKLTGLGAETTYYYFTEVISNGTVKYSQVGTFRTGKADSYVDWEDGDHVGGEI